jgi:integrase
MALTKRLLDTLGYEPGGPQRQVVYDGGDPPGFGVRLWPSGRKTFVLHYRPPGKAAPVLFTIGNYGALTLRQARDEARRLTHSVRTGRDPAAERRESRKRQRSARTVREFAAVFVQVHRKKDGSPLKTLAEHQRRLEKHILPALGSKKLEDVCEDDVRRLHDRVGQRGKYEANRTLALIRVFYTRAMKERWLDAAAGNPAEGIEPFPEKSRDVWVPSERMPLLIEGIRAEASQHIRAAFWLYLLTGLRKSELLNLKWGDVDLEGRVLRLPDTKSGFPHSVPLSAPAVGILRDLPRQLGTAYLFPGAKAGRPLVNLAKPWARVRARYWLARYPDQAAELRVQAVREVQLRGKHARKDEVAILNHLLFLASGASEGSLRLHDLRRTVGSWLAMGGASLPLIGKLLNHSSTETTQIYARLTDDAPRRALEEYGEALGRLIAGET